MTQKPDNVREIRIYRYDPHKGGAGEFQKYFLNIPDETTTTILDVLLRLQREQDPSLAFRYACRVNMCGSCGMVINGKEGLACKTNVSHIAPGQEVTLRPLNHFPVIKDLVVDMEPFFQKYEEVLPFYHPKEEFPEPLKIPPDSRERQDIGLATECIACGCCVSSCTMCHYHDGYVGPAALNRAFTLLADSRDGLFDERLERALASCYHCRTEFNCTEVCPKNISGTRAIKYIQRLAVKRAKDLAGSGEAVIAPEATPPPPPLSLMDRRTFARQFGVGVLGVCAAMAVGGVAATAVIGPSLSRMPKTWLPVAPVGDVPAGGVSTINLRYDTKNGLYTQANTVPVLISRTDNKIVCFKASCPHLGCTVKWDASSGRFRCACHGGIFDREGKVIAGPPPRPLDQYAFKVESGHLLVEVG